MVTNKAEVVGATVGVLGLLFMGVGLYGTYTSDKASTQAQINVLEKEHEVSTVKIGKMEEELDVLWVDTQKNAETIKVVRRDQERFDEAFIKFADATDRLSISVARLEERIGIRAPVKEPHP